MDSNRLGRHLLIGAAERRSAFIWWNIPSPVYQLLKLITFVAFKHNTFPLPISTTNLDSNLMSDEQRAKNRGMIRWKKAVKIKAVKCLNNYEYDLSELCTMHLRMIYGNELFVIHPVVLIMSLYNPQWKAYCSTHPKSHNGTLKIVSLRWIKMSLINSNLYLAKAVKMKTK